MTNMDFECTYTNKLPSLSAEELRVAIAEYCTNHAVPLDRPEPELLPEEAGEDDAFVNGMISIVDILRVELHEAENRLNKIKRIVDDADE